MGSIMANTPHSWPSHTTNNFPAVLVDLLSETNVPKENIAQLKKNVEEEWRSWGAMSNENDIIQHFSSSQGNNLFLSLLLLVEDDPGDGRYLAHCLQGPGEDRGQADHLSSQVKLIFGDILLNM